MRYSLGLLAGEQPTASSLLVGERAKVHAAALERGVKRPGLVGVIDNSGITSFVQRRMHGRYEHLNLAEIWGIESANNQAWLDLLSEETVLTLSFPEQMIIEYDREIVRLEGFRDNPHGALRHKWNRDVFYLEPDDPEDCAAVLNLANNEFSHFMTLTRKLRSIFQTMPSEGYVATQFRPYVDRIQCALSEINSRVQEDNPVCIARSNESHKEHDRKILATAVGISYATPVFIFTGDKWFVEAKKELDERMDYFANKYHFPVPPREVIVVHNRGRKNRVYGDGAKIGGEVELKPFGGQTVAESVLVEVGQR